MIAQRRVLVFVLILWCLRLSTTATYYFPCDGMDIIIAQPGKYIHVRLKRFVLREGSQRSYYRIRLIAVYVPSN